MASRGRIKGVWMIAATLVVASSTSRAAEIVELRKWADEGTLVRGKGMGEDVIQLVVEARWDEAASKDPARYLVRVAFPDGRVDTRPFPVDYPPGRPRFVVYIPAEPVRDRVPGSIKVAVTVVDASSSTPVSNTLTAGIEQFPRPKGDASAADKGPFGWGKPLEGTSRILPNPGPDGFHFARIAASGEAPGVFLATTEATVEQVRQRLKEYDPKAGRSDEFALEDPSQPAINLSPSKAKGYLEALGQADPSGVTYRLPTIDEWTRAAKGGKAANFWWGDEPTFPSGANLLGPEPALAGDATAPSQPPTTSPTFEANPFGLAHTFGNASEWATDPAGGFARMGGHFRTEPASPLPVEKVAKDDELGPDPFVGVRPAAELTADSAMGLLRKRLEADPKLAKVAVSYDPDRALVTLTGPVDDPAARRSAARLLEGLWFVASVDDRLETPAMLEDQLAVLGPMTGPARRLAILDRTFVDIPLEVRWLDPLPVSGTSWWVNLYFPGGGHESYRLDASAPGKLAKMVVRIDRDNLARLGLPDTTPSQVALSLGSPAPNLGDARVVTNAASLVPSFPPRPR